MPTPTGYSIHQTAVIDNRRNGNALTAVQVKVTLPATFPYSLVRSDGHDVAFYDADNATLLSHWRQAWNTSGASTFYVLVPAIAANATRTLHVYAGKASSSTDTSDLTGVIRKLGQYTPTSPGIAALYSLSQGSWGSGTITDDTGAYTLTPLPNGTDGHMGWVTGDIPIGDTGANFPTENVLTSTFNNYRSKMSKNGGGGFGSDPTKPWAYHCWWKSWSGDTSAPVILFYQDYGNGQYASIGATQTGVQFIVHTSTDEWGPIVGFVPATTATWTQVSLVRDGAGNFTGYINGRRVIQTVGAFPFTAPVAGDVYLLNPTGGGGGKGNLARMVFTEGVETNDDDVLAYYRGIKPAPGTRLPSKWTAGVSVVADVSGTAQEPSVDFDPTTGTWTLVYATLSNQQWATSTDGQTWTHHGTTGLNLVHCRTFRHTDGFWYTVGGQPNVGFHLYKSSGNTPTGFTIQNGGAVISDKPAWADVSGSIGNGRIWYDNDLGVWLGTFEWLAAVGSYQTEIRSGPSMTNLTATRVQMTTLQMTQYPQDGRPTAIALYSAPRIVKIDSDYWAFYHATVDVGFLPTFIAAAYTTDPRLDAWTLSDYRVVYPDGDRAQWGGNIDQMGADAEILSANGTVYLYSERYSNADNRSEIFLRKYAGTFGQLVADDLSVTAGAAAGGAGGSGSGLGQLAIGIGI